MSNEYFNHDSPLARHTLGRAETVNAIFSAIAAGFAKLPGVSLLIHGKVSFAADTGAEDAYAAAMPKTITAYQDGTFVRLKVANTNTGAATLDLDGIGPRPIKLTDGTDPKAGDLTAGDFIDLAFSSAGNAFVILSQSRSFLTAAVAAKDAAEAAQGAAEDAQDAAEAAYDSFDDRYLGAKASDPATDNDGNDLLTGAFYWKTGSGLRVWDGGWNAAVLDVNGALVAANNLSDLTDTEAAKDNLGFNFTIATTTATATPYQQVAADVTGGAWTLSLPASPTSGDWVRVAVVSGDPQTDNLTVSGNGNNINGDANLTMDALYVQVSLIFNGTEWRIG